MSDRFTLIENKELEGYNLIDNRIIIEHDGVKEGALIATIYEKGDALGIIKMMTSSVHLEDKVVDDE